MTALCGLITRLTFGRGVSVVFHWSGEAALTPGCQLVIQQTGWNFTQETAGGVEIDLVVQHTLRSVADIQLLLGAGNGHIAKAAFFFNTLFVLHASSGREDVFLQTGHEYDRKFQTFGAVNGHERYALCTEFSVIQIGNKRNIFQIIFQRRRFGCFFIFSHRAKEFIDVFNARFAFI